MEDSKASFFEQLQALNYSSDGDEDTNELKALLLSRPLPVPCPFPSPSEILPNQKRVTNPAKKMPAIHRTTSAPVRTSRIVAETPALQRKNSLLRHDISAEVTPNTSFTSISPLQNQTSLEYSLLERRTVSTPTFGSVIMTNSKGIANMLNNNSKKTRKEPKKRKSSSISEVPESERIFQGKTFFYIPPNDVHKARRDRITRATNYGAIWTKEWTSSITHVVVDDSDITFNKVLEYLKDTWKVSEVPSEVVIVNKDYPMDCILQKHVFNPDQPQYKVKGSEPEIFKNLPLDQSQLSDESLKPNQLRRRSREDVSPPRGPRESSPQAYSPGFVFPDHQKHDGMGSYFVESPRENSPIAEVQYKSFGDEFDEVIKMARMTRDLPIDDDEEDDDRPSSSEGAGGGSDQSGSEGERAHKAAARKKRKTRQTPTSSFNEDTFSCMKGGTGVIQQSNPNRRTIDILQQMADYYDRMKDQWRCLAYRKAIRMLSSQTKKISTYDEAIALNTIGHRLATKIEEIVLTNRLRKLENALQEPGDKTLQLFMKVYSAGIAQGEKWVRAGYKTLDDLVKHAHLTPTQRIGVEHYDDFMKRIPREEVTALGNIVQTAAAEIDGTVEVIISGSYRRGAASSGDIDCMITRPGTTSTQDLLRFLYKLVDKLTDSGFLVAALAVPGNRKDSGSKWHGACVLPSSPQKIWRRIDFLLVPASEFGAALIYFTGDDIFNRSLRLLASKKGMRLNQRGLYKDVMRGDRRAKVTEGTLLEGEDEKRIFAALGVPWRPPHDRICG